MEEKEKCCNCLLPSSRVRTIMKSSPEVSSISQESLFMVTKATELFVKELAQSLYKQTSDNSVEYSDLASLVEKQEKLQFLQDIIPKKIKYSEYLAMMEKKPRKSTDAMSPGS